MPTIQELREQRGQKIADARKILDLAATEKRDLTADESAKSDALLDEADKIKEQIEAREKAEDRARRLEDAEKELRENRPRNPAPRPGDNPGGRNGGGGDRGRERENRSEDPNEVREISWRTAGGETRRIPIDLERRGSRPYREAFARYLLNGTTTGLDLRDVDRDRREERDLAADSDPDGGYTIAPTQMVARLIQAVDDAVVMRQFATVLQLRVAQNLGAPSLDTDASDSEWTSEVKTGSNDTAMKFGTRELNPSPLAKRIRISRKLLRNSAIGIEALVQQRLAYKFGVTEEKAFLTGTGANQPLGVFVASANGISTGRDVQTGSATDWTADGLIDCKFTLKPQYWPNARWLMHRDGLKRVRKLKDSTNQYLWQPGLTAGEPDRILDIPYTLSEFAPNTFTSGKYVAVLGDLRFYWIAEALSLEVQRLNELYAETNQVGYIGRLEVDGMPVLEEAFVRAKTN